MLKDRILDELNKYEMNEADIMIYFFNKVVIGRYEQEVLLMSDDYNEDLFDEIHIFNKDKELRWNREYNDCIEILDPQNNEYYFEEEMYIIGNRSTYNDGYTKVTQNGREIIFPYELHINNAKHDLRLAVHHLFDEQASISGYRLVEIRGGVRHG